jgi:hypothetical protein
MPKVTNVTRAFVAASLHIDDTLALELRVKMFDLFWDKKWSFPTENVISMFPTPMPKC